jgi:hypothetical protein
MALRMPDSYVPCEQWVSLIDSSEEGLWLGLSLTLIDSNFR